MEGIDRPTGGRVPRRTFLAGSASGLLLVGCGGDDVADVPVPTPTPEPSASGPAVIDFADGDVAVLNFAYALEQLEAAFYAQVNEQPPGGLSGAAKRTLEEIGAHELIHREFFKAVLGKDGLGPLEPDFSKIDFTSADSVLAAARDFEDLGVAAYNGAAQFLTLDGPLGKAPLQAAGEIVSVEARHASAIRTLIGGDSTRDFAPAAFDDAKLPDEVLKAAMPFLKTGLELRNAPKQARA